MLPALVILGLWAWFGGGITRDYIVSQIPTDTVTALDQIGLNATIARINALASGYGVTGEVLPYEQTAGDALRSFQILTFLGVLSSPLPSPAALRCSMPAAASPPASGPATPSSASSISRCWPAPPSPF